MIHRAGVSTRPKRVCKNRRAGRMHLGVRPRSEDKGVTDAEYQGIP